METIDETPASVRLQFRKKTGQEMKLKITFATLLCFAGIANAADYTLHAFTKQRLTNKFWTEAPTLGDIDRDGHIDIVAGPFWYQGPEFKKRTAYYPATETFKLKKPDGAVEIIEGFEGGLGTGEIVNNTDSHFAKVVDFNGDQWPDILLVGQHPGDVLIYDGWWEQPASLDNDPVWKFRAYPFAIGPNQIRQNLGLFDISPDGVPKLVTVFGGSQMYVDDVNSDGLPDVIMSLAAHGYGLAWWEQLKERDRNDAPQFKRHMIINSKPADNKYGVSFSEMQAVAYADIDGDGLKDIVTGKRWWSHAKCCFDPESDAPAVLYWFKQVRNADKTVEFVPYFIDDDSGAGTQVTVGDVDADGHPDIVVANKKGAHLFTQKVERVSKEEWEKAQPKPTR